MPRLGVDNASAERAYASKPNIGFPGTQAQADNAELEAVRQAQAQGTELGTPPLAVKQAHVAPPAVVHVSTKYENTGAFTPTLPPDLRPNDLIFIALETNGERADVNGDGWSPVPGTPVEETAPATTRVTVFTARYRPGLVMPQIVGPGGLGTFNHVLGVVFVVRGVKEFSSPFDGSQRTADAVSNTALSLAGVTTNAVNELIVGVAAIAFSSAGAQFSAEANGALTSIVEQADFGTVLGDGGGLLVFTGTKATAGAVGATTTTLANASVKAGVVVGIQNAVGDQLAAEDAVGAASTLPTNEMTRSREGAEPSITIVPRIRAAT